MSKFITKKIQTRKEELASEHNGKIEKLKQSIVKKDKELECKDTEIAKKDEVIARRDRDLAKKDRLVKSLETANAKISRDNAKKDAVIAKKDEEITKKDREITKKDKRITSLEAVLRLQFQQTETVLNPVDLENENDGPLKKRVRAEDAPESALAVQHEQNQQFNQRLVQVKQELEDAEELVGQQVIATDRWQGRFGELADMVEEKQVGDDAIAAIKERFGKDPQGSFMEVVSLLESCQVDGAAIAAIRSRSLASGS